MIVYVNSFSVESSGLSVRRNIYTRLAERGTREKTWKHWVYSMEMLQWRVGCAQCNVSVVMVRTFELDAVPETGKAHELAILALREMRQLVLAVVLLEPFIEALCDNYAALLLLHGGPHAAILDERVIPAVDRLHLRAIVGVALGPEGDESYVT